MMYETVHDAEMRLNNSIVRYAGKPVLIQRVYTNPDGEIYLLATDCLNNEEYSIALSSPNWDFSSPPLGYVNFMFPFGKQAYYVVRMPARKQVQGVVPSRLTVLENGTQKIIRNLLSTNAVCECIANIYRGAEDYQKLLSGKWLSNCIIAFSRDIAVSLTRIYYRAYTIGTISHVDNRHIVTITRPSFVSFNFKEVFDESWTFNY